MTPLLETRGLTVRFGGVTALADVALAVEPREIAGLIGPNGAGKTTLLAACCGFLPGARGRVLLDGQDVLGVAPHRIACAGLVRTFQGVRAIEAMTVLENVLAGSHRLGGSGAWGTLLGSRRARAEERESHERAEWLLGLVGLEEQRDAYPTDLSTGQLRLLEIARTLAAEPKLVLLDEPAAGLNREETARLEHTLLSLNEQGLACVLVEHDVELVLRASHRVTVLDHGRVIAAGDPAAVRSDPAVVDAYLGPRADRRTQLA